MSSAGKKKSGKQDKSKNAAAAQAEVLEQMNKALEAEMLALEIQLQQTDEKLTNTLKQENLHKEKVHSLHDVGEQFPSSGLQIRSCFSLRAYPNA